MLVERMYETIINLTPKELYNDIDTMVMAKLVKSFENTCKNNSMILKVTSIVRRSIPRISRSDSAAGGDVTVQFMADALYYERGDIIVVTVDIVKQSMVTGFTPHLKCNISTLNKLSTILLPDMKVPVRINESRYAVKIAAITDVYVNNEAEFNIYKVNDMSDIDIAKNIIAIMGEHLLKLGRNTHKESVDYFATLYYPYKKKVDDMLKLIPSTMKLIDLLVDDVSADSYVIDHPILKKNSADVLIVDEKTFAKGVTFAPLYDKAKLVEDSIGHIVCTILEGRISYCDMLDTLAIEFPSKESLSNNVLWQAIRDGKV